MKKLISILFVVTIISGLFWGCEKKENPPALPPAGTMSIDFSTFSTSKKSAITEGELKGIALGDKTNWLLAATTAGVWNIILAVIGFYLYEIREQIFPYLGYILLALGVGFVVYLVFKARKNSQE